MTDRKPPQFTLPPNALKAKVGEGGIPAHMIRRGQEFLETNPVDYTPYAARHLDQLNAISAQLSNGRIDGPAAKVKIVDIVMQLKSNGSMFHYQLISMVSDVMLRYLEKATVINQDFFDILAVYSKILASILSRKLTGNGGREGYALAQELHNACHRYMAKHGGGAR